MSDINFKRLTSRIEIKAIIEFHNKNSEFVTLDVETTSKEPRKAKLLDVQLSGITEDSAVIFNSENAFLLTHIRKDLPIVAHNYKYDAHVLFRHGIDLLEHRWRDTLLLGHLLDENRESYSLDSYVKEYWNDNYKEEFWTKYKTYKDATSQDQENYACRDIVYTGALYRKHLVLADEQGIPRTLVEHVHRLQASLLKTEIEGLAVDLTYLQNLGIKIKSQIDELQPRMRELVKDEIETIELESWEKELEKRKSEKGKAGVKRPIFNFESSGQLSKLLYGQLCLPPQKNDKTKAISTDYGSLEKIKGSHPVVGLIQENRELQKVYGTYIEGSLDKVDYDNIKHQARIYPQFRVAGTVTGRISHSNPNLAQLPKQGGVRGIYVPDRGRVLISADYNQLEVIVEANLTADKNLIRMLENGESKHDLTARELRCDRSTAKTLNFALQYWCSHFKVAKLLGISVHEGLSIYNRYWEVYSGAKKLKAQTDKMVNEGISLVNLFGRKRRFGIKKRHPWDSDYRQAYNFMIQSTGSDITSKAFYTVDSWLRRNNHGRGLFTVHDELLIEVNKESTEVSNSFLITEMEAIGDDLNFKIPLKAESSGPMERWLD